MELLFHLQKTIGAELGDIEDDSKKVIGCGGGRGG